MEPEPLLKTKLFMLQVRSEVIERARLIARLNAGKHNPRRLFQLPPVLAKPPSSPNLAFAIFQKSLSLPTRQTHLLTWQQLFARAEATFDPAIQPLLAHVRRLSYLREPFPPDRLRF